MLPQFIAVFTLTFLACILPAPLRADAIVTTTSSSSQAPQSQPVAPSALSALASLRAAIDADPASPIPQDALPATQGLCIIIRAPRDLGGEILAIVSNFTPDAPPSTTLTAGTINRALDLARTRLAARLPAAASGTSPQVASAKAAELLRLCTFTLETISAINPLPVDTLESLDMRLAPLAQGFAVSLAVAPTSTQSAAVFPLESMLAGLPASASAGRALASATGNPQAPFKPLTDLTPGPTFFTFQTSQATEVSPGTPLGMMQGQIPLPQTEVDSAEELATLITTLAKSLSTLTDTAAGQLPDEIDVATNRTTNHQDPHRAAATQALALLALQRATRTLQLNQESPLTQQLASARAALNARLEPYLIQQATQAAPVGDLAPSSLTLIAPAITLLTDSPSPQARQAAIKLLTPLVPLFATSPGDPPRPPRELSAHDGLLLSAMLRASLLDAPAIRTNLCDSSRTVIRTAPWSIWLLLGPAASSLDDPSRKELSAARQAITRLQARFPSDTPNPADLGGLLLPLRASSRLDASSPAPDQTSDLRIPTWRTLPLTAALPSFMFNSDLLPPQQRAELLVSSLQTMRYLRQLQIDPGHSWFAQDPAAYQGLVRLATWETRVSVDATSLGLLAACDTLAAAKHLAKSQMTTSPSTASPTSTP